MSNNIQNGLRSWLVYPHRLTDRLAEEAGEASLHVLNQGFVEGFWQREIVIMAKGEPCWYARTLVPESTYFTCQYFFDQLKTKSLGELIYNSAIVQRTSLVHYPIGHAAVEFQWLPEHIKRTCHQALWIRSSYFRLRENHPFYLKEIFLPAMQIRHWTS